MVMLGLKSLLIYLILPDDQAVHASSIGDRGTIRNNDNHWTNEELLEEIIYQLKSKKYNEMYNMILAAVDNLIVSNYRKLFQAVFEEYDEDFKENGISDPTLENTLILLKSYGTTKDKLCVLLECSDRASTWKAFLLIGGFMEEIMPELDDLSEHFTFDIIKVYMPSWIERFEMNVVLNYSNDQLNKEYFSNLEADYLDENYDPGSPDAPSELFLSSVFMFLRIFTLSMSKNYKLLDDLCNKVLACTHIHSDYLEILIMKLDEIYKFSDRRLPFTTPVLVNSLKSRYFSLPRVFSPEYYLKLIIKPLHYSLHVSTSNMFNIGYVVLVLRNYLNSVKNESIGRNEWTMFLDFLADFLVCCEESTLYEVRVVCMDTFKIFLSKFEPVAQLLIIRKLFTMIRDGKIQRKNLHRINVHDEKSLIFEPHFFAWIIDLFRSNLNYEVFRRELNFFWGDIMGIRYSCLSDGLQYYLSVFILAQEQALRKIDPELMLNIYKQYLQPLQSQISDWTELVKVEERQTNRRKGRKKSANQLTANMKRLETETRRKQNSQSLPLLQFQYSETLNFVTTFLRDMHMV